MLLVVCAWGAKFESWFVLLVQFNDSDYWGKLERLYDICLLLV
ncbi:MAG: hypothetical protein HCTETUND2_083 [Candidatus Hodgkinia cicadicola]|nr:MAG: hypothetical protein HCTETUND1_079 [Candidatus Hodgkinia cicadicola]AHL31028.1 MAG: hypothetical protein HCTETUND2_083 [Candidatus Hodgkinia cicadicola]